MINKFRQSIGKQLSFYMTVLILLILLGGVSLFVVQHAVRDAYQADLESIHHKTDYAISIQQNMVGIVAELRGAIAFGLPEFQDKMREKQEAVNFSIKQFEKLELTQYDQEYLDTLIDNKNRYFNEVIPAELEFAKVAEHEEWAKFILENGQIRIGDDFRQRNIRYVAELREQSKELSIEYNEAMARITITFSLYLVLIGGFVSYFAFRFSRDIGYPLRMLATTAEHYEEDKIFSLPYARRSDEIGNLTRSLQGMFKRIHENEREMLEQNDEMLAQQEELIMQQDELYTTLTKMEEKERILEAQNLLNTTLVNTLDRDVLLKSIIRNLLSILHVDKGIIVMLEHGYPRASLGISDNQLLQFIGTLEQGVLTRVREEDRVFTVTREALPAEKGYHDDVIELSDLYIPIRTYNGEVVALVVLTRVGRKFNREAVAQSEALANQIALSIEKLRTYEASERDRVLNQEIIDSIREGVQLFDEHGHLVQFNQTWCSWMGDDGQLLLDRKTTDNLFELLYKKLDNPTELIRFIQRALIGNISEDEKMVYHLGGMEKRVIQVYFEKIYDARGEDRGTVLVHRDMTREYEVDQMKSEFVSTVSHELRTPLSSVLGFTELMLNKELKPERQKKYLTTIHKEAQRLTQLINDFLDIQRMESGRQVYEMADVDMVAIAVELTEQLSLNAPRHQLKVETMLDYALVRGDENKLRQVLMNLVSNAVKYSPIGGDVTVRVREVSDEMIIEVSDQGLGIPKEAIDKLFTKFYRVDNSDRREIGGTGLGLAICKEIVKAHNGRISVDSVLGEGSTFSLHFPRNKQAATVTKPTEPSHNKPTLLIVEDDNSLALLLKDELKESGFLVTHVHDGETALKLIVDNPPDAVVLDIMLENSISGWEVIEQLKKNQLTEGIPIFISSALDEKERGLALGAADYLTKPYQPSKLSNLILQSLLHKEKNGLIMVPQAETIQEDN